MTGHRRLDLPDNNGRMAVKLCDWPKVDRAKWEAKASGVIPRRGIRDPLPPGAPQPSARGRHKGHAWAGAAIMVSRRPRSLSIQQRTAMESVYGLWLAHLHDRGQFDPDRPAAERASDEAIDEFVARLRATCRPGTVHEYVKRLLAVCRVVAPAHDWSRLAAIVRRLTPPPPDPTRRMEDIRHPAELLAFAEHLMEQADSLVAAHPGAVRRAAVLYRDGLMLAVLVFAAIRRGSLLALALGDTLLKTPDGYLIMLRSEHTKARRPEQIPVHPWLASWITRYLSHYRPALLGDRETPAMWISERGQPISPGGVWVAISTRTKVGLGVRINPHFVRHCIATSTTIQRPQDIGNLPAVLQHRDFRVTERHYILANNLAAFTSYHDVLDAERAALARGVSDNPPATL